MMRFISLVILLISLNGLAQNKITYIGDSHSAGPFGDGLSKELERIFPEFKVERFAVCGSNAKDWLSSTGLHKYSICYSQGGKYYSKQEVPANFPNFPTLMKNSKGPVVVALGTNDINGWCKDENFETIRKNISLMKRQMGDRPCVWVGPPDFAKDSVITAACGSQNQLKAVLRAIKDEAQAQKCFYVDSSQFKLSAEFLKNSKFVPNKGAQCLNSAFDLLPDDKRGVHFAGHKPTYWAKCVGLYLQEAKESGQLDLSSPTLLPNKELSGSGTH